MREAIFKKDCIFKTSSAYKGVSSVSLIQIDILYIQSISNSTTADFTQSKWHIIHRLRKGEDGHMHSFLPVTVSHTTFSTVNDIVQKTNRLNDKNVFFPFSLFAESQRLHWSPPPCGDV